MYNKFWYKTVKMSIEPEAIIILKTYAPKSRD
jgi:hypothetical protein